MTIEVFPNGADDYSSGHVSINLNNKSNEDINVKCQLITDVEIDDLGYGEVVEANSRLGFSEFLTHTRCENAYKDKDFVLTAKFEINGENVMLYGKQSAPASKKRKFMVWEDVYEKMQNTDFTLVFDGKKVPFSF